MVSFKHSLPMLLLLTAFALPVGAAEIVSWGETVDPDDACQFSAAEGRLRIEAPSGMYDLHYGNPDPDKRFNAPRVWREVEGDFTVQVKVAANWKLGESIGKGRNYTAAGLLVWDSEQQYLRHERCHFINPKSGTLNCFITPLYDLGEKRVNWKTASADFFRGDATWLRLSRQGQTISTWLSHDGETWIANGFHKTKFPKKVRLGLHLLNGSLRPATADFSQFTLLRGPSAALSATPAIAIPNWGKVVDPDGDCIVIARDDRLIIVQPPPTHDLWYGRAEASQRYNAPRVLQEVEGDFTMQVKVINRLDPPLQGGRMGGAAGLLVYESDQHYFRQERNRFVNTRGVEASWIPPLYDRDGVRISTWAALREGPFAGEFTWLFLRRIGQKITTGFSNDGKKWVQVKTLTTTFPKKVQVGLLVHATSSADYGAEFQSFKLTQP